jgi:penicillin-binding protein 2
MHPARRDERWLNRWRIIGAIAKFTDVFTRSWVVVGLLIASCAGSPLPPASQPAPHAQPTPTPDYPLALAADVLRAFTEALNRQDFSAAFALLADAPRATLRDSTALARSYQAVLVAAAAQSFYIEPRGGLLVQDGRATAALATLWESNVVGPFTVTSTLALTFTQAGWRVDWTPDAIIPGLAEGVLRLDREVPIRGAIYAADGTPLAVQQPFTVLGVQRGAIADAEEEARLLALLSAVTGLAPEAIKAKYADQPADWFSPIAEVDGETLDAHYAELERFPAVGVRLSYRRAYPQPDLAPHVVGFVGPIPAESLEAYRALGYQGDEQIGLAGVEATADGVLAGLPGGQLKLFANGSVTLLAARPPEPAQDVTLTISPPLQLTAQRLLGAQAGAVVVLRAGDNAVLAMASWPSFSLDKRPRASGSLLNRATQGQYPAGSTFKMVTMAAAIGEGLAQPAEVFRDPGYWDGLGRAFRKTCWLRGGHGRITLRDGLTASCNVVFYALGLRLHQHRPDALSEYARRFGFGRLTGIELPEAAGLVPDPDWKRRALGAAWTAGDTVNLAIGQGALLVTPLQVAQMTAALANGGVLRRPYIIAAPRLAVPQQAESPERIELSALSAIQQAMIGVTRNPRLGTATYRFSDFDYCFQDERILPCRDLSARARARARRLIVAGKSGTAQAGGDAKPFAWFTAYAPADAPEIVVTVVLENAGEGSALAAPLARQLIEHYYGLPLSSAPRERRVGD